MSNSRFPVAIPIKMVIVDYVQSALNNEVPPHNLSELCVSYALSVSLDLDERIDAETLVKRTNLPRSTVGRIINEYLKAGIFVEEIDPDDRRKRYLLETDSGLNRHLDNMHRHLDIVRKGWGPDIVEVLMERWEQYGANEDW